MPTRRPLLAFVFQLVASVFWLGFCLFGTRLFGGDPGGLAPYVRDAVCLFVSAAALIWTRVKAGTTSLLDDDPGFPGSEWAYGALLVGMPIVALLLAGILPALFTFIVTNALVVSSRDGRVAVDRLTQWVGGFLPGR